MRDNICIRHQACLFLMAVCAYELISSYSSMMHLVNVFHWHVGLTVLIQLRLTEFKVKLDLSAFQRATNTTYSQTASHEEADEFK